MFHFAYGANMAPAVMRKYAPGAEALGIAQLGHHRFIVTADGYASVVPACGRTVHGVLWRLTPRDRAMLDAWENVGAGLYRATMRPVQGAAGRRTALVYVSRCAQPGRPKSGYMELVITAARASALPAGYIASLREWLPQTRGADEGHVGALRGEFRWT
jgi:hypothetical protein